jgi:predicted acyltransferase
VKQRYYSLDVFRGATVALMILVNNPGTWSHIYGPLEHAPWHGITPTDLVFPFFLFAVGNAMAFVMPRLQAAGEGVFWRKVVKRSLLIFAIGLFLNWWPFMRWQGDTLQVIPWTWTNDAGSVMGVRILGVLQRIALCYFFASIIIYYAKPRGAFLTGLILLLLYWLLCVLGNPADPYSLTGWFGTDIDKAILHEAHMYRGEQFNGKPYVFDPEGLMSTIPAIVQVILGYLVGDYIIKKGIGGHETVEAASHELRAASVESVATGYQVTGTGKDVPSTPTATTIPETQNTSSSSTPQPLNSSTSQLLNPSTPQLYVLLTGLFIASMAFLFAGYAWGLSFPINKKIWTSSYVMLTTGMATAILATLIYAIEVKGVRGWWTRFFDVFGKNALFVFALSAFLPKGLRLIRIPNGVNASGQPLYLSPWNWWYEKVTKHIPGAPELGSLAFALTVILFMWAICYWLDRKRIYIKV